jgi:hypothetical protein
MHDFMSFKQPKGADGLRSLVDKFNQMHRIFDSLGMSKEEICDAQNIYLLQEKMDKEAMKQWMLTWKDKDLPTLGELKVFLAEHAERRIAQDDAAKHLKTVSSHHTDKPETAGRKENKGKFGSKGKSDKFKGRFNNNQTSKYPSTCNFGCKQSHPPWVCPQLLQTRPEDRFDFVKQRNLCVICLGKHRFADCTSNRKCRKCDGKHNSVLHYDTWTTATTYHTGGRNQPEPSYADTTAHTMQNGGNGQGPSTSQQQ